MSDTATEHSERRWQRGRWYLNRLRCMSPIEIPHRIARSFAARVEACGLSGNSVPAAQLSNDGVHFARTPESIDVDLYLAAADRIVDGRFDVFALRDVELGTPPRWNRDPKTGVEAPNHFGKLLDYRDPALVGDIKYLWELNRHQHLVTLSQAYALSGNSRYANCLREHLDSWFRDCPFRIGPNWSSALEPAMRLINWSLAWQLLGGVDAALFGDSEGAAFRDRWLDSVYRHARFVKGNLSRHSSANNHLIGEAAGLYVGAMTWPLWPDMRKWQEKAAVLLEREVQLQNGPDGVNREQAVAYQQFEFDLLLMCWLSGNAGRKPFSDAFAGCMERMAAFIAAIMDVAGNVPMIGDSDDGYVVRLSQEPDFCPYRSVLVAAAAQFGRGYLRRKAPAVDDKTRWLMDAAESAGGSRPFPREFPTGGYYLLTSDPGTDSEICLLADAGPLGYGDIAAHGHADALAFTLSVGGQEFLIDPGTYAYHADNQWREYFRGTSAHNTVRIDGRSQSEPGGNFMWLSKANAGCTLWQTGEDADVFEGWQDGYRRLHDPVMHHRRIVLHKPSRRIRLEDRLLMNARHDVELHFHCSEQCRVEPAADGFRLHRNGQSVLLTLPGAAGGQARLYRGSTKPVLGWVSRHYDRKEPATTIVWRATLDANTVLRCEIRC